MNGDLFYSEEDFYSNKMPSITAKQFNVPMSVRGIKNITLAAEPATNKRCKINI